MKDENLNTTASEVAEASEKQQKKLKRKLRAKDLIIVILIVIILVLLFLRACTPQPQTTTEAPKIQQGTVVEKEVTPEQEVNKGRIFAPAIPDFSVSKADPYVNLFSPEENAGNYLLKYQFVETATGKVIYESDYLEGGFKYSVDFGSLLDVGEYDVTVNLTTKDAVTYEDKNGTVTQIKVTVTE